VATTVAFKAGAPARTFVGIWEMSLDKMLIRHS
jgi:hypothetical protein